MDLRLFIFIVGVTAGGWLLYKAYDTVVAAMRAKQTAQYSFTVPFAVLSSGAVWRKLIGFTIDMVMSSVIYMFYGITAGGQLGAGMASTLALLVSVGIYVILEADANATHEQSKARS